MNSYLDVEDLFRLQRMAFVVEIALAKARKHDSKIQIKDKQDLVCALTDQDTFAKILDQGSGMVEDSNNYSVDNKYTVGYFMRIKDN